MAHSDKPPAKPADRPQPLRTSFVARVLGGPLGPLAMLVILAFCFAAADESPWGEGFTSVRNVRVMLVATSTVAVAALGMTLIIISGGIDLSAGTALTLCSTVMAYAFKADYPPALVVVATLSVGILCGIVNGTLVSLLRVVPFIVTLGTLTIYLGLGKLLADESTIFPPRDRIPEWLRTLCSSYPPDFVWGFVPNIAGGVWIALALAVAVAGILRFTVFGRYIFALGSSEATARLCGIPIVWTKIAVYALAGVFVGIAGIYHFSVLKIGNPGEGQGLELEIIAAVVIGGGSLSGGRGTVIGTLTGAALMAVIRSGCDQLELGNPTQKMILGAIIIVAVALDQLRQRRLGA